MANLAIRGHATRGKEVIEILKMLGGKIRRDNLAGNESISGYYITEDGYINWKHYSLFNDAKLFTLEEFFEKYPYKVGDKVGILAGTDYIFTIKSMAWNTNQVIYKIKAADGIENEYDWFADELMYYTEQKEKTIEEKLMPRIDFTGYSKNKYIIDLGDYDIKEENGKTYAVRKQPQYPKTYVECCDVLIRDCVEFNVILNGYNSVLLEEFGKLLICRDAYWKLADNWKPDWNNISDKHCIYVVSGEIWLKECQTRQCTLAFPIAAMRDAFYENFKDLIEQCKELL